MDFTIIDMQKKETIKFHELSIKENHKDPFDRMLIWQSITKNMTIISNDGLFEQYKEPVFITKNGVGDLAVMSIDTNSEK